MDPTLKTTLVVNFGVDNTEGPLTIEGDPGIYFDSDIRLLLFPGSYTAINTNIGSVRTGFTKTVEVPPGVLQFGGGSTAQLPKKPVHSNPQFKVLFAFDLKGVPLDISVSNNGAAVNASKDCHAAVAYSGYLSSGLQLIYSPGVEAGIYGSSISYGVVAVYKAPSSIITHQVQPSSIEAGNVETELYRIVSYAVTTPEGEFEAPPGYPSTGTYPNKTLKLDVSTSLRTERVHEIGYMDSLGRGFVRSFHVTKLEPYIGDGNYTIPLVCKESTLPQDQYSRDVIAKAKDFVKSRNLGCKGA
jgi:hypothetical protein